MGKNYVVIDHLGLLHSCQMTLDDSIGTINNTDLIEKARHGNFITNKKVREEGVDGKRPCNLCQWKNFCCGGCPLLTFEKKGKFTASSPYCAVYRALIPEVLKCEAARLIYWNQQKQ